MIVVSESAGDEAAVAVMTAGAKDFLLRDKLDRLPAAVERELGELAKRRAQARTKLEERKTDELLRMLVEVIGTPGFMAPEQAASDAQGIGPWTDLYGAGVVLYSMLTGRLPFQGSGLTMLLKQLDEPPLPPTSMRPDLDPQLEEIVLKAMARRSQDRYQTAGEFIDAIDGWLAASPNRAAPTTTFHESAIRGDA